MKNCSRARINLPQTKIQIITSLKKLQDIFRLVIKLFLKHTSILNAKYYYLIQNTQSLTFF